MDLNETKIYYNNMLESLAEDYEASQDFTSGKDKENIMLSDDFLDKFLTKNDF